jgi:hypothetical protein
MKPVRKMFSAGKICKKFNSWDIFSGAGLQKGAIQPHAVVLLSLSAVLSNYLTNLYYLGKNNLV